MSGIYQQSPRADAAFRLGELDPPKRFVAAADGSWPAGIPGTPGEPYYDRPAGYFKGTVDWETITEPKFGYNAAQGNNTDGLIDPVTNVVKTQLPPNSRSFILGPLVDGFVPNHISDAFTRIGYIEKDTRQFVLLASFTGEWISGLNGYSGVPTWNGTSTGFTQVNPNFTLDMALWFRNEMLKGRYVKNVSYNAVGGIPQPQFSDPDAPQPLGGNGVGGGSGTAGDNPDGTGAGVGSGGEPNAGTPQGDPDPGKDPGQNDLWGMGARRRRNRRGSGARGNRGRRRPDPTPSPTPDPQGGRGGGTGNPTNRRGSGARGNRNRPDPTPSPKPDRPYTPRPQGGRGGGQGNPTNQRGSGQTPRPTPSPSPKPDRPYTPRPQGGRGGGQGNPTNPRGSGARPRPTPTPSPKPTGGYTPRPQGGRGGGQGNPTNRRGGAERQENKAVSNLLDKAAQNWQSNTKGMGDKIKDNIKKVIQQGKNVVKDIFDANNAADFNTKLAINLGISILTGKKINIPLSDAAKKSLVDNINAEALKDALKLNDETPTTADEAINPSGKKSDKVLGGGWDAQGGVDFNYNEETGELEITSNKTLRTDSGGESTIKDRRAPNFDVNKLTDIPDASKQNVQDMSTKIISDISTKLGGPGLDPNLSLEQQLKFMRDNYDDNAVTSAITDWASEFISQTTQGTAQNILALRQALKNIAIKTSVDTNAWKPFAGDSDIESVGGAAGHVTSTTKVPFNQLPPDVQAVIRGAINAKNQNESFNIQSKKRILREIRQPLKEIKELPKTTKLKGYKPNFKGKFTPQNTPDVTSSKKSDRLVMAKNAEGQLWSVGDKYFKGWETTNRMNHVYSRVGESDKFFEQITANNSADVERKMQEHLNHVYHNKAMLKIDSNYQSPFEDNIEEQETYDNKINDPLFTKVAKRLKKEIDYKKKPAKVGYPNEAPPKIDPNTGMHPKFGKRYKYDKLDPISAKTMAGAPTGDPEIDTNVKKAAKIKENWRSDLKNLWLGSEREDWKNKIEEGMTTQVLTGILPSTGNADLEVLQTGLTGNGNIDYGEPGVGDEAMEGEGEYTCFTNLDDLQNVNDPNNIGTYLRIFDQETKEFRGGSHALVTGGGHGYLQAIPGYKNGMMRNVKPSGDYNAYEKSRRERLGLPALQGGSNLYYHLYGPTNDVLGLGYGTWNSNDGVTAARTGTRLDFNGPGSPRFAALKAIDSTGFDTIKIHALLGDNDIVSTYRDSEHLGGTLRDKRVQIYYWAGDHKDYVRHPSASHVSGYGHLDGWRPINLKPNGEVDPDVDPYIIKHTADRASNAVDANGITYSTNNKNAPYSLPLPDYTRSKNARYMIVQADKTNIPTDAFSVLSVRFQRRSNIKTPALTKPLTDIETSPFVRVGPTKKNEGGKERKKKVKDIIDGGLKYTETKFSKDFPVRTTLE